MTSHPNENPVDAPVIGEGDDGAPAEGAAERARFGIRARLMLAFAAVAATTLVASGVGWISYGRIEQTLSRVADDSLPSIAASLQLAEKSTAIVGAAPRILATRDHDARDAATLAVQNGIEDAKGHLAALAATGADPAVVDRIRGHIDEIAAVVGQLTAAHAGRIEAARRLADQATAAAQIHGQYRSALGSISEDTFYNITMDLGTPISETSGEGVETVNEEAREAVTRVVEQHLPLYQAVFELRAESDGLKKLLDDARVTEDLADLGRLERAFDTGGKSISNSMSLFADAEGMDRVRQAGERLLAYGTGPESVFALRAAELQALAQAESLAEQTRAPAAALEQEVKALVDAARAGAEAASADSEAAITSGKLWLLALAAASVLAAALIGWFYVRRNLIARLAALGDAMRAIAGGDLQAEIPSGGRDEIAEMAAALVVFRDTAAEVESANARAAAEREAAAVARREELHRLAAEFEETVKHVVDAVSAAARSMRGTAEGLVDLARQTTDQANAVVAASENASGNVGTVASAAEELSHSVEEIGQQVAHSARIARQAVEQAGRTNGSVRSLQEAAQKIGEIGDFISGIAGPTNLLALNATNEAARAGEAGKGFAVVASEVKSLANQTAKATEQIAAQIAAIQSATGDTVGAIDTIGKTIAEIDEIAAAIAAAVEEQGAATQEIARNTQQAAVGTQEVSSHIVGVTGATERTGAAAGGVLEAAGGLAAECDKLQAAVTGFLAQVRAA